MPSLRKDYAALDGWRGVCACLVALYHFREVFGIPVRTHVLTASAVQHGYLFVDFFFVLSGFVIASSYQERIAEARISVTGFLALRLGRLYPLHVFTLLGILVTYTYVGQASDAVFRLQVAPIDTRISSFLVNVFLVQGLHTTAAPTWNHPSWSISTEFASYVVYALLWKWLKNRTWIASALIIAAAPPGIALLVGHMDTTFQWGILRSLLGFALGAVVFNGLHRPAVQAQAVRLGRTVATMLEVVVLLLIALFVAQPDHTKLTIAAPFVFAVAVAVFSFGRGVVSALLASRPFRHAGAVSYSVYLLHAPLQELFVLAALWCAAVLGWPWLFATDAANNVISLGTSDLAGDAVTAVMLFVLLAVSTVTWRLIESPCRAWMRARVQARSEGRSRELRTAKPND